MAESQPRVLMDPVRIDRFLEAMRASGSFSFAALKASAHLEGRPSGKTGQSSFRALARRSPEFRAAVDDARLDFLGRIEATIASRALNGWDEPVYQGGELVGTIKVFDNKLLLAAARRHDPEAWSDRSKINVTGAVAHAHLGLHITLEDLDLLPEDSRANLLEYLTQIAERRDELQRIPVAGTIAPPPVGPA